VVFGYFVNLHAPDTEDTKPALVMAAKEAWQSIDSMILYKLSSNMPHHVKAMIGADGWYIKYPTSKIKKQELPYMALDLRSGLASGRWGVCFKLIAPYCK
jgi:hypothetical protein